MTEALTSATNTSGITAFNSEPGLAQASEESTSSLTADFETFLKLLTTQMRNQDPQEPIDSTEFVSQLASFSAVEQQISTNTKLDDLIGMMNQNSTGEMAAWIGTNVRTTAPAEFSGTPIDVFFDIPADATSSQLVVENASGTEIARLALTNGQTSISWDGKGSDGITAADGAYSFRVQATNGGQPLDPVPAETFSPVSEVRVGATELELVFAGGKTVPLSEVRAVR